MKRVWQHPEDPLAGKRMFRSLGEMESSPGFQGRLEREFPQGAAEFNGEGEGNPVSRRNFMRLMGASTALAGVGLASCRRPIGKILPYAGSVEWMVPGKAVYYATAMPRLGGATPIIAKVHEGRPTHLQGNPLHPASKGCADHFAVASILDFYDPERSRSYKRAGKAVEPEEFWSFFAEKKKQATESQGKGLAFLHGANTSPTRQRVAEQVAKKLPDASFYEYEAVDRVGLDEATLLLLGKGNHVQFKLDKAQRILSIGCDFLGVDRIADGSTGEYSKGRKVDEVEGEDKPGPMNRLYVLEHQYTITGGMADHRFPVKASEQADWAAAIAQRVADLTGDSELKVLVENASKTKIDQQWVDEVAKDLHVNRGKGLVVAGPRQDSGVHALCLAMNMALGNVGADKPLDVVEGSVSGSGTISELAQSIKEGKVSTLVISAETDPVYSAPADLKLKSLLKEVDTVIHLGVRDLCATARAADWHVPGAHFLESWGDVRASDGTYSIIQPMIAPLFDGVSETAFLLKLISEKEAVAGTDPVQDSVKETFAGLTGADSDGSWNTTLRNGFLRDSNYKSTAVNFNYAAAKELVSDSSGSQQSYEIVFTTDNKVWDGRHINNGWLQELPDPITSLVWDNAALVSFATLKKLAKDKDKVWENKDLVIEDKTHLIKINGHYFPVLPAPGHAEGSISISMGYGQEGAGSVAGTPQSAGEDTGPTSGFNVFPLRNSESPLFVTGAEVELVTEEVPLRKNYKTQTYPIAITQEHFMMEGRALYRDGTHEEFEEESERAKKVHNEHPEEEHLSSFQTRGMDAHIPANLAIYRGQDFDKLKEDGIQQWGMSIDLNQCIGCTSCTIACQSENNIPIVGKDQVIIGREMHWIRMDRYFAPDTKKDDHGHLEIEDEDLKNPQFMPQPIACTHCEAAPCETVCPVNATVHTEEGLNAMAYNRCIGTRYCANNCPYKARRFNFFDYNRRPLDQLYKGPLSDKDRTGVAPSLQLQKNPNVSVRMRGVMEKCTYCVQRIQEAKINQKRKARDSDDVSVPDGAIKVACQQACPADAIVFGDVSDADSKVSRVKASPRNYELLKYLGLRSRTTYLARIKNPNMKMPGAEQIGTVSQDIH